MPRKTRQQKILAELRTLRSQLRVPEEASTTSEKSIPSTEGLSKSRLTSLLNTPLTNSQTRSGVVSYDYLLKDLRKVALLGTIALLIEIVLSLTLNFGFANLLKDVFHG